jgi:hypothetical protein
MKLSEELIMWRCDRPDEWKMDEFKRNAEKLEAERDALAAQVDAIANDRDYWKNAMGMAASVLLLHKVPTKTIDVDKALAEIRAEAAYKALTDVQEEIIQRGLCHSAPDFIEQYAAKIRQGSKP